MTVTATPAPPMPMAREPAAAHSSARTELVAARKMGWGYVNTEGSPVRRRRAGLPTAVHAACGRVCAVVGAG